MNNKKMIVLDPEKKLLKKVSEFLVNSKPSNK